MQEKSEKSVIFVYVTQITQIAQMLFYVSQKAQTFQLNIEKREIREC